jgi:elongation factor G
MDSGLDRLFYRETVRESAVADGKIIRQRSGTPVYAHVRVTARALSRGKGVIFAWNAGSNIPARFAPAVAQGIKDAMDTGVLAGLEVTDVLASVDSGSYHEEDSNAEVFREAAKKAMAEALLQAHPVILEAVASVIVAVAPEFVLIVEKTMLRHGARAEPSSQSNATSVSLVASVAASQVDTLMADLLEATGGGVTVTSTISGFQLRSEPPETAPQWAAFT